MTKVAYLDCPTGIAGDMCLGAIVDAGMPLGYLVEQLATLGISDEYLIRAETVHRNGQRATKVHVDLIQPESELISTVSVNAKPIAPQFHSHPHSYPHSHPHSYPQVAHGDSVSAADHSHPIHHQGTRHLPDIERLIQAAPLSERVKTWSLAIFQQLAQAEGAVHGIPPEQVHFHEVGATDAIADIVGTCIGLDWLDIDQLYCSALPTGGGTVWAAHGRLPVPAPAVLHLLQMGQVPIYSNSIERELVTPTGAAIATTLATSFGPPPAMTLNTIGLGAGGRDLAIPNILRLWLGESSPGKNSGQFIKDVRPFYGGVAKEDSAFNADRVGDTHPKIETPSGTMLKTHEVGDAHPTFTHEVGDAHPTFTMLKTHEVGDAHPTFTSETTMLKTHEVGDAHPTFTHEVGDAHPTSRPTSEIPNLKYGTQTICVLETQLDDLNPQIMGYLFDRLLNAGALDVFTQAVGMKKSRPGILLTVLCLPETMEGCESIIYRETTTLGIRRRYQERSLLHRELHTVSTSYGPVSVKLAFDQSQGRILNIKPEYEDCARLAQAHQVSLSTVHDAALDAAHHQFNFGGNASPLHQN